MAFHYGRDANIAGLGLNDNWGQRWALIYHLTRCAGADWLWECDGEYGPNSQNPNHVADGNMETSGTASYVAIGTATISKDTSIFKAGTQSLKVISNAQNDGVRTVALLTMTNVVGLAFGAGDTITGPVNGVMTIFDAAASFTVSNIGCPITLTGTAANDGTFIVTDFVATNSIKYQNPLGAPEAPPTGSYSIRSPYEIVLWAYNNSGVAWNVDVDQGDGSYVNVGTIPDNSGVWTLYHYDFETLSTGSRYIRIVDPAAAGQPHTIYVDSILVFRSNFEYQRLNAYGTDGVLANPDQFSSASYVPDSKDIGKWLLIWDATNPSNSGWYKIITDLGGGTVQVDMRSGTAVFTANTGLTWRIVDVEKQFEHTTPTHQASCGFGIESPHTSGWRMFMRACRGASASPQYDMIWAAPDGTATFDMSTGAFYLDGPSTQKPREGVYQFNDSTTNLTHLTARPTVAGATRTWLITDDDLRFIDMVHWYTVSSSHGHFSIGYLGSAVSLPTIESFSLLATTVTGGDEMGFSFANTRSWYYGTTFSPDGQAVQGSAGALGYSTNSCVIDQSNASDNPWSSEEVIFPLILIRDPEADDGCPAQSKSDAGLYMGRANLPDLATFDSDNYLHFKYGFIWEWNGEAIIP